MFFFEMVPFFWCFLVKFSWWLNQPIWQYEPSCIISPMMKIKNLWNHHPEPCLCEYSHGSGIREDYMQVAGGSHVLGILGSCDPSISLKQLINRNGHQLFAFRVKEGVLDLEIDRSVTLRIPFSTSMMCFCSVFSPCRPPYRSFLRPLRVLRRSLRISCGFLSSGRAPLLHKSPFAGRAGPPQRWDLDLFDEQWELDISIHEVVPRWCKPPWPNLIPQTLGGYLSNNLFNPDHGSLNQPQKRAQSQNCQVGWKICVWKIRLFLFKTDSLSSKMLDSLIWGKKTSIRWSSMLGSANWVICIHFLLYHPCTWIIEDCQIINV